MMIIFAIQITWDDGHREPFGYSLSKSTAVAKLNEFLYEDYSRLVRKYQEEKDKFDSNITALSQEGLGFKKAKEVNTKFRLFREPNPIAPFETWRQEYIGNWKIIEIEVAE